MTTNATFGPGMNGYRSVSRAARRPVGACGGASALVLASFGRDGCEGAGTARTAVRAWVTLPTMLREGRRDDTGAILFLGEPSWSAKTPCGR